MPKQYNFWTAGEIKQLETLYQSKPPWMNDNEFAKSVAPTLGRTVAAVSLKLARLRFAKAHIPEVVKPSPYPIYNEPLVMEGDALILPDLEFPFHHAEFVNRVLDLAEAWKINQLILAGDVLHFDSLSGWDKNWDGAKKGGMSAEAEEALMGFAKTLSAKKQGELFGLIGDIGEKEEEGISGEMGVARREMRNIAARFDLVHFLLGNHEGRLLRALGAIMNPDEILRLLEADKKWHIAPYYFGHLDTVAGRYQIEHPKGAAEGTAQQLAAKYHCHIIMGHSHLLDHTWDVSGNYHAIHAGHCVDEARLAYTAQRHVGKRMHKLGAVIVVSGYPYLLSEETDWERMKRMG